MRDMFFNYDNNINKDLTETNHCHCNADMFNDMSIVRDRKGNFLGIKVKYNNPISLYFHLDDLGSNYLLENGLSLYDLVVSSRIMLKIETLSRKVIIEKEFDPTYCYNYFTSDLFITLDTNDIKDLKQESYRISLSLAWDEDSYELFSSNDGLLIIR